MKIAYFVVFLFLLKSCTFHNVHTKPSEKKNPFFHHWFTAAPKVDTLCWWSVGVNGELEYDKSYQLLSNNELNSLLGVLKKSDSKLLTRNWEKIRASEVVYANYRIPLSEVTTAYILSIHSAYLSYPTYVLLYNHEQEQVKEGYLLADYKQPSEGGEYDCYSCWTGIQSRGLNWLSSYNHSYSQYQTLQLDNGKNYSSFVYFDSVKLGWCQYQKEDFQPVVTYGKGLLSRDEPTKAGQDTLVNYHTAAFYYCSDDFRDSIEAFNALNDVFNEQ